MVVLGRVLLAVAGASLAYVLAAVALDPRAALSDRSPRPPSAVVDVRLGELGLSGPLPRRYAAWASGVVRGDFGETLEGTPVGGELWRRAGVSLRLVVGGFVLGTVGGVLLGSLGALSRYGLGDRLLTAGTLTLVSVPVFAVAVLLQTVAQWVNARSGARIFEWTGEYTPGAPDGLLGRLRHLLLPTTTPALGQLAICARYQRGVMLDVLNAGYVRTAMAKGLRRRQALLRHGLRVAILPTPTFAAYAFAGLLTGAAITEKAFGWHGLGEWLIDSIYANDVNAVAACGCAAAAAIATVGLLADLSRTALDPQARS
jgi:peptide/nickel transport system permease protein